MSRDKGEKVKRTFRVDLDTYNSLKMHYEQYPVSLSDVLRAMMEAHLRKLVETGKIKKHIVPEDFSV